MVTASLIKISVTLILIGMAVTGMAACFSGGPNAQPSRRNENIGSLGILVFLVGVIFGVVSTISFVWGW